MTTTRCDAVRNRELVLRTAARILAEEGAGVSLSRIAQRAGVGAGTIYRHFPSKQALLEAVLAHNLQEMLTTLDQASGRTTLVDSLLRVIDKATESRVVCEAMAADHGWPQMSLDRAIQQYRDGLDRSLRAAQLAGTVRADLRVDDLTALIAAGTTLITAHRSRRRAMRLVRTMLEGLRSAPVTELAGFRDGHDRSGHETTDVHCAECGDRLSVRPVGRPRRYCGPACRQRARRRRLAG
ncbi:TetR/AcrR family transcriptional regulator [Pseudonocardiaceae bacterium YIM PH 21723]|nr:TetR/AcrR family transcriptional regulator [Pseudonocardiaceae bacterium YIM PH 21723]